MASFNNRTLNLLEQFGGLLGKISGGKQTAQAMGRVARSSGNAIAELSPDVRKLRQETIDARLSTLNDVQKLSKSNDPKIEKFAIRMLNELEPLAVSQPQSVKRALLDGLSVGLFTAGAASAVNSLVNLALGGNTKNIVAQKVYERANAPTARQEFELQKRSVEQTLDDFAREADKFKSKATELENFFQRFKELKPTGGQTATNIPQVTSSPGLPQPQGPPQGALEFIRRGLRTNFPPAPGVERMTPLTSFKDRLPFP